MALGAFAHSPRKRAPRSLEGCARRGDGLFGNGVLRQGRWGGNVYPRDPRSYRVLDPVAFALVFLVGIVAGFASGLFGIGGGTLMVPAAIYLVPGTTFLDAKAASLLVISAATVVGILRHRRHGNVDFEKGVLLGIGGVGGTVLAVLLAERTPEGYLKGAFGLLLALTGVRLWWDVQPRPHVASRVKRILAFLAVGFASGLLVGFFGIGGGILVVPALVFLGAGIHVAVGTSLVFVLINALVATGQHLALGYYDKIIGIGIPLTLGSLIAIRFGTDAAAKLHPTRLRRAFAVFLVLMGLMMVRDGLAPTLGGP